jgi:hypothetical protein
MRQVRDDLGVAVVARLVGVEADVDRLVVLDLLGVRGLPVARPGGHDCHVAVVQHGEPHPVCLALADEHARPVGAGDDLQLGERAPHEAVLLAGDDVPILDAALVGEGERCWPAHAGTDAY